MIRPDPPGVRGADPPGERIAYQSQQPVEREIGDESDESVPRNDFEEDYLEVDEEEEREAIVKDETKDENGSMLNLEQNHLAEPSLTDNNGMDAPDDASVESRNPILDYEPDCTKANAIGFYALCNRLEKLWQHRNRKTNRQSKDEVFTLLVDDSLRRHLEPPASWFPLFRLVLPDIDTSRPHTGMKEKTIAQAWADAFDLTPGSQPYERLLHFTDPTHFSASGGHSDLSLAVQEIVEPRDGSKPSKLKLMHVNELLDELVAIKGGPMKSNHDWRDASASSNAKQKKGPSVKDRRREWVRKLRDRNLSALEHKWIVRILLQKMEIGYTSKTILNRWQSTALELYRMNNNLRSVCTTLSNPYWIKEREEREQQQTEQVGKITWMEHTNGEAALGNTITPMLALKVYFRDAMAELCRGHRAHARKANINLLQLKNPAFICEVKLDGERMVVHVKRGIVRMHTRRGRWYSDLYSPALAPPIRRALQKWDVDVIFDGEVIAWDNAKQEAIPFGNNRTIAMARQRWMQAQGLLESRDQNLHEDQPDVNVMKPGYHDTAGADNASGSDCWLRYEIFDVLFVGGPQAPELIATALNAKEENVPSGSIIHLNAFQRKRILYHMVTPQEKEVILVPSLVVRPNGMGVNADEYFATTNPTSSNGVLASDADSIEWALDATEEELEMYDDMRNRFSDVEIGLRRAEAADRFYADIVDVRALEGVLLKDLNATYLLDGRRYWAKHKPDFEENAELNDIDLIILGAYHGTGMGPSGKLNAFLCGCVDDENPEHYMAVTKVNGGSMAHEVLDEMLASTGYKKQTANQPWELGQWFREDNHGKSIPDFISKRSFQNDDGGPPVFDKKKYPDLWINPEDSIVLTVKASEITAADGFQAGITLRFPRIERVRMKNTGDDKAAKHVETLEGLHRTYREQMQRREGSGEIEFQSGSVGSGKARRRFQTAEEGLKKKVAKRNTNQGPQWKMPLADRKESSALDGLTIAALEGVYNLDENSLDAEEAKEQGWFKIGRDIKGRDDLLLFISKHSGAPKISISQDTDFVVGGRGDDARVMMHHKGLEQALKQRGKSRSKVGLTTEDLIRIGGVLKWTYLVSMVHQWNKEIKSFKVESGEDLAKVLRTSCIKSTHANLLKPARHQYFFSSCSGHTDGGDVFGINTMEPCTLIDFKRGLQAVGNQGGKENSKRQKLEQVNAPVIPWQLNAEKLLPLNLRWIMGGELQKFWPFPRGSNTLDALVVYPDLFDFDFGERDVADVAEDDERWNKVSDRTCAIASCLPLTRAMGARVTPHLHGGVTHVLCEMSQGCTCCESGNFDALSFRHPKRARRIKTRLGMMNSTNVTFVSPEWIRNQWRR